MSNDHIIDLRRVRMATQLALKEVRQEIKETALEEAHALREQINGEHCLRLLAEISLTLYMGHEVAKGADGTEFEVPLSRERVASLKAAAELQAILLRKILPDAQQVNLEAVSQKGQVFDFKMLLRGDGPPEISPVGSPPTAAGESDPDSPQGEMTDPPEAADRNDDPVAPVPAFLQQPADLTGGGAGGSGGQEVQP